MTETLAHRLPQLARTVRRALAPRPALLAWHDAIGGVRTPGDVGRTLVGRLDAWLPLAQWTLPAVTRLARTGQPVSLLFLDLDAFKCANDTYGHLMGSRALVEVGALLQSCTRATDTVARYGGDEFVVVLPETDRRQVRVVAHRMQQRMATAAFLQGFGRKRTWGLPLRWCGPARE